MTPKNNTLLPKVKKLLIKKKSDIRSTIWRFHTLQVTVYYFPVNCSFEILI